MQEDAAAGSAPHVYVVLGAYCILGVGVIVSNSSSGVNSKPRSKFTFKF